MTPSPNLPKYVGEESYKLDASQSYVRFNETTWALPDSEIQWRMRYAEKFDGHLTVASMLDAYDALIWMPERERNRVIAAIRTGLRMRLAAQVLLEEREPLTDITGCDV